MGRGGKGRSYVGFGQSCVPLRGEVVVPVVVLVVCGYLLGGGVAHQDGELGLVEYLTDAWDGMGSSVLLTWALRGGEGGICLCWWASMWLGRCCRLSRRRSGLR